MEIAWMLLICHNLRSLSLRWDYLHAFKFPWILLVLKKFGPGQKWGMKGRVRGEIRWWGCYSRNVLKKRTLPHHVKVVTPLGDKVFLPVRCILSYLKVWFIILTIIQLTISFLIGRKRTVNFRNQRLGRHLAADYTIIMSRTLKVTGNHVMYDRGAWFLRVIMSSLHALCLLCRQWRSKNMTSMPAWLTEQTSKKKLKTRTHKRKKVDERGKVAVCWLSERKKTERTWGKEKVGTNFENILSRSEKERIRSMYNKTIITFGFRDIQNNQGKGYVISLSLRLRLITLDLNYSGYHKNLIQ